VPHVVRIQSRICVGGPALHSILLSEGLSLGAGSRYETTLVGGALEPGEHSLSEFALERGVQVHELSHMRRAVHPGRDAAALASLVRLLRRLKPDIVHTHTAKAGALGRTAARLAGVPTIVHTFHGHTFDGYFSSPATRAFVQVERGLSRFTDCVVAISEAQRFDLVERYRVAPAHRVRMVPLGLELDRFRACASDRDELRAELGLPSTAKLVVFAGRLVPIKRPDVLLSAFERVLKAMPEAHLLIAGDGEATYRRGLEQLAREVSGTHIHFLGLRRDLPRLFGASDVFALSSDNEGTPVAVIEALAAGLPVAATDVGGVSDILAPHTGRVVPGRDAQALALALIELLRSGRRLSDQDRDDVVRKFSHRRLIKDVTDIYDELMSGRGFRARVSLSRSEAVSC
jgi:glycosyltransferase involved in cell wall biosynthesis